MKGKRFLMKTCVCCGSDMVKEISVTIIYRCKTCENLHITVER